MTEAGRNRNGDEGTKKGENDDSRTDHICAFLSFAVWSRSFTLGLLRIGLDSFCL